MNKCCGELIFIFTYVTILILLVVAVVFQLQYGKIYQCLVEFAICIAIDMAKSIPCQALIYWVIVRRLGTLPVSPEFQDKWDDDIINAGGVEPGIIAFCRKKV
jgi:hypothetical protein